VSFTALKSSMSHTMRATDPDPRIHRRRAWSIRSANSTRLASPVSGSWDAWWASSDSRSRRSLTVDWSLRASREFSTTVSSWRTSTSETVAAPVATSMPSNLPPVVAFTTVVATARPSGK
jgi:hypothetical protein